MEHCYECGFDHRSDEAASAGPEIVQGATILAQALNDRTADLVSRREPDVWSPLEYGCHLRDVLLVQRERVLLARREDRPSPPMMGREERAEHDGYSEQDPSDVARQLADAARMFANVLSRLGADWDRLVTYQGLQPPERSLRWIALDTWHEVHHHLRDIKRQLV